MSTRACFLYRIVLRPLVTGQRNLFAHTGVRPPTFVDADEERQKRAAAALGDLPDFASCQPRDAFATAMAMYSTGKKLPLLLAGTEEGAAAATLKVRAATLPRQLQQPVAPIAGVLSDRPRVTDRIFF